MMNRTTPLTIVFLLAALLAACGGTDESVPVTGQRPGLQLQVESPNGESEFRQADQPITYNYVVTNTGPQSLNGPVIVNDAPRQVFCPQLNTVGNLDDSLDFNESVTCTALYTPSDSDRSVGSITNRAVAIVGGATSNESTFTLGQAGVSTAGAEGPSQTPSAIATVTQGASPGAGPTETQPVMPTATGDVSAATSEAPAGIPTATPGSSGGVAPGPGASVDSVNVIDLPAGTEMIILPGVVPAGGTIRYSINATQGQQLSLNFIVTTNQLALTVTGPDGTVVKPGETGLPWSGTLSTTGDYLIDVVNMDSTAVQPYALELRRSPAN